jgi:hypothetical protein
MKGFRWRGHEVTRLEGFSFPQLMEAMRGFIIRDPNQKRMNARLHSQNHLIWWRKIFRGTGKRGG